LVIYLESKQKLLEYFSGYEVLWATINEEKSVIYMLDNKKIFSTAISTFPPISLCYHATRHLIYLTQDGHLIDLLAFQYVEKFKIYF